VAGFFSLCRADSSSFSSSTSFRYLGIRGKFIFLLCMIDVCAGFCSKYHLIGIRHICAIVPVMRMLAECSVAWLIAAITLNSMQRSTSA
jgi:hypothetical protein